MNLLIVESPTKAKTLSKFLGKDYTVTATIGHIKDLPKSQLGIDIEHDFKPEYVDVPKQVDTIKNLQKSAKKASKIYIATDPDREGEAIASHVEELISAKSKTKRIEFHEITKEAVEEAITHPRGVDKNLVNAQAARRVLDRLVGYKLSPVLWKKVRIGLSAGRVQTVALRLIVEREAEIEKFKPVEYWEISTDLKTKASKNFTANLLKNKVDNKKSADQVVSDLKKATYTVSKLTRKEVTSKPYPPYTTSTMTQAAARIFGWSSKKTMRTAQSLYEQGLITYHRTDSLNLAVSAVSKVRDYIQKEYGNDYLPPSPNFYKTNSKSAQEAHEAIRPTNLNSKFEIQNSKLSSDLQKLYNLIWKRFVACQMSKAIFDRTTIDITADKYLLRATGQIIKFNGWKKLYPKGDSEEGVVLPEVNQGDSLKLVKVNADQKFTEPPPRFNEASIIKTLESLGIGRPSTYAPTISTIQVRKYVEKLEGKFFPTPVGTTVSNFLVKNFPDVFEYQFTAEMEDDLDKVAQGKVKWPNRIGSFWKPLATKIKKVEKEAKRVQIPVEKLNKPCPECGKEHRGELVIRVGRFGKFISCSRFPDCKYTEKFLQKINFKCPKCGKKHKGEIIVRRTKKGRPFFGCSRYPECDFASWTDPSKPAKGKKVTKKTKTSKSK